MKSAERKPSILIGIPAYNEARFILETIRSLQAQTYADFAVVISDNASSDGTAAICNVIAESDSRFRLHRQARNMGAAQNFEWLLRNTSSDLFMWLGAHDMLAPEYLEIAMKTLGELPDAALFFTDTQMIDEAGSRLGTKSGGDYHLVQGTGAQRYRGVFRRIGPCEPINNLFRRSALEGAAFPPVSHIDLMIICLAAFRGSFVKVDEPYYIRRILKGPETVSEKRQARLARVTGSESAKVSWVATISEFYGQYKSLDKSTLGRLKFATLLFMRYRRRLFKDILKIPRLKTDPQ